MSGNGFQTSYANDKPPSSTGSADAAEMSTDPASSSFFTSDFKRHEDLKAMLDSNKDAQKLEAMKRIVGMVAKGKDASDLFPAVVKNVVAKNLEIKKLVYVYLTRYAEEQQDLALLSISTFQRALRDPNQLIRASALRVLSSIRVSVITPIMMLAIKEAVMDMSPYVRKTAAHAIPKLYSIEPEIKEQLIEVLERLLGDKTTLVAGSAIQAFEEVCPERIDLIHKNYRKLCNLLVDVEEWGQVVIINMLTRYCRTQFVSPNLDDMSSESDKPFYEDSDKEDSDKEDEEENESVKKVPYMMDPDHRLLLRQAKPLLNSRNAAVVMAVGQLYHHCSPKAETGVMAKALIRLLRSQKEIQFVVLSNVATMTSRRKGMFEPFLKSFYIRSSDPLHIKLLKLEILTNLATETNISTILREFQTYVTSPDKEFAASTIQAIGRCASSIAEVTDTCLNGLVHLMSNRDESVVAESVVVIKKLLQMRPSEHKDIIVHMAKMVDKITVPMARASILWLIGEYSERVPKIAPDVLRKAAKTFITEEDIVKLQILNLAAKLCITNAKQCKLLCQYVFNLSKYDQNYDIRDRSRFLRQLILPGDNGSVLAKYAKKIFLSTKPAPVLESKFKDRDHYQLGTLSHLLNIKCHGYQELPEWPQVAPDPSVRNVEVAAPWVEKTHSHSQKKKKESKSFYSDTESSEEDESSDSSCEDDDDEDEDDSSQKSDEKASDDDDDSDIELEKKATKKELSDDSSTDSETDSDSASDSSEENSSDDSEAPPSPAKKSAVKGKLATPSKQPKQPKQPKQSSNMDLLLDLDDSTVGSGGTGASIGTPSATPANMLTPTLTPTLATGISNMSISNKSDDPLPQIIPQMSIQAKSYELLNRITGGGLSINYKFTRTISVFSPKMVSIELIFTNSGEGPLTNIKIGDKKLQPGMEIQEFNEIKTIVQGMTSSAVVGINFNDTTQPAKFDICTSEQKHSVSISAPVGEIIQPHSLTDAEFKSQQGKLSGMNENSGKSSLIGDKDMKSICTCVHTVANVIQVPGSAEDTYRFSGKTIASGTLVLISVVVNGDGAKITVNCEKMVIGTMLLKDLKNVFEKS